MVKTTTKTQFPKEKPTSEDALDLAHNAQNIMSDVAFELKIKANALSEIGMSDLAATLYGLSRRADEASGMTGRAAGKFVQTNFRMAQDSSANMLRVALAVVDKRTDEMKGKEE